MAGLDWRKADLPNPDPARVINVGVGWSKDTSTIRAKKKRKRKRAAAALFKQSTSRAPTIIPQRNLNLIASIFTDLGRPLPRKRNRLNNRIRGLIKEGVINEKGDLNRRHDLVLEWFEKVTKANIKAHK